MLDTHKKSLILLIVARKTIVDETALQTKVNPIVNDVANQLNRSFDATTRHSIRVTQ